MGYDRYPELLIDEKTEILTAMAAHEGQVFFTHDHEVALGRVARSDKGRFFVQESWTELKGAPL